MAAPILLLWLGLWLEPDPRGFGTHEQLGFAPCFPMSRFGIPCPGCGMTTALALASHGRLWEALRIHAGGPALLVLAIVAAGWALVQSSRGRDLALEAVRIRWSRWGTAGALFLASVWLANLARARSAPPQGHHPSGGSTCESSGGGGTSSSRISR